MPAILVLLFVIVIHVINVMLCSESFVIVHSKSDIFCCRYILIVYVRFF